MQKAYQLMRLEKEVEQSCQRTNYENYARGSTLTESKQNLVSVPTLKTGELERFGFLQWILHNCGNCQRSKLSGLTEGTKNLCKITFRYDQK